MLAKADAKELLAYRHRRGAKVDELHLTPRELIDRI
jgi:hypothetical protein